MSIDLTAPSFPADLVPPANLADRVLRAHRRRRRGRLIAAACAVLALALGAALPGALTDDPGPDQVTFPSGQPFPAPGGGPKAIQAYPLGTQTYLLDPATGRYRTVPAAIELSPDLTRAAVTDGTQVGLADRLELVRDGLGAVRWLPIPPGNGLSWSPDGSAFAITSIEKSADGGPPTFTVHRYTLATDAVTDTRIPSTLDTLGGRFGWAADSRRYLALLAGDRTADTVEPGALQYVNPDGSLSERLELTGGLVRGPESYSPSRLLMIVDSWGIMSATPHPSLVVELRTGQAIASIAPGIKPIGWYDERTVIQLTAPTGDRPVLELVDLATGTVTRRIELPGLPFDGDATVQIGDSTGLADIAVQLGF